MSSRSSRPSALTAGSVTPLVGSLYTLQIPIPYPMKTVTVLLDVPKDGPVTLIDCALDTEAARQALYSALQHFGLGWSDVKRLIVTHHHPDHYGLAGFFEEQGASVYMLNYNRRGQQYWQNRALWRPKLIEHWRVNGAPQEDYQHLLVPRTEAEMNARSRAIPAQHVQYLQEGETVELSGASWQVLWLPGHADGHLGLWNVQESILIAGDSILPRISPHVGVHADFRPDPLGDYFQTLSKIAYLDPACCVVGHFGPTFDEAKQRSHDLHAHHLERLDKLLRSFSQSSDNAQSNGAQPNSAWNKMGILFRGKLNEATKYFALTETLAHLEHLRYQGLIERFWDEEKKIWLYGAK